MKQISPELLQKYSQHLCTDEEKTAVEEWLNDNRNILNEEGFNIFFKNEQFLKQDIWNGIRKRKTTSKRYAIYKTLAAACIAGIIIMSGILLRNHNQHDIDRVANLITFTAPVGVPSVIFLSDSSSVHLIAGSSISYAENFSNKKERLLTLNKGEIFLEVTHNAEKPFLVHSEGTVVKVLGTKFNVKNNPEDSLIAITLNEGSIQFETNNRSPQLLTPGQQLIFNKIRKRTEQLQFTDLSVATGWINKQLVFNNTSVHQVLERLKTYYSISFIIKGKPDLNKLLTGTFDNMDLEETLNMITFSTGIKFKIQQHTVTIY